MIGRELRRRMSSTWQSKNFLSSSLKEHDSDNHPGMVHSGLCGSPGAQQRSFSTSRTGCSEDARGSFTLSASPPTPKVVKLRAERPSRPFLSPTGESETVRIFSFPPTRTTSFPPSQRPCDWGTGSSWENRSRCSQREMKDRSYYKPLHGPSGSQPTGDAPAADTPN